MPLRNFRSGQLLAARSVEEVKHAVSVFVTDERDGLAVVRKVELVDIPRNVGGEILRLSRGEIDVGKAVKFGVFVCGDVDTFAVFAEGAPGVMDLVFRFRIGRGEGSFLAARCVDEVEITFVGGDFFDSEKFRPSGDQAVTDQPPPVFCARSRLVFGSRGSIT